MTGYAADGTARTFDVRSGNVGYMPFCYGILFKIQEPHLYGIWKFLNHQFTKTSLLPNGWC